jgi:hypothetical protein
MEAMISFVDAYRDDHGVEPICKVLTIAPSTYRAPAFAKCGGKCYAKGTR